MTKQRDKGYLLPAVIDPGAVKCIRVYIPDDPLYWAAFWGSYEYLTTWIAWERDETKRGKDAGAVWRPLFLQARAEWLLGGGCGVVDVRQSPEGCVLEKTYNGVDWIPFADLTLCQPNLTDPPYTETLPDGRTPEEATIDDILYMLKNAASVIRDGLNGGQSCADILPGLSSEYIGLTGQYVYPALVTLCDDLSPLTPAQRDDAVDNYPWGDVRSDIVCQAFDQCGHITDWQQWLNCTADKIYAALNSTASAIFDGLNALAGALGGSNGAGFGGTSNGASGGGAGFGFGPETCEWSATFDFTIGPGGWSIEPQPPFGSAGEYRGGQGFGATDFNTTTTLYRELYFGVAFTESVITGASFTMDRSLGFNPSGPDVGVKIYKRTAGIVNAIQDSGNPGPVGNDVIFSWSGELTMDQILFGSNADQCIIPCIVSGDVLVKSATITGKGVNPFA